MDHATAVAALDRQPTYVIRGRPGQNDRPALPSGHHVTWGAITDGTVLDGEAYPFPVFETPYVPASAA